MSDIFWIRFFVFAAIFNMLAGLPLLLAPDMVHSPLPLPAESWLFVRTAGGLIVAFGVGYALVASDLVRHRSIAIIGAFGKLIAFALLLIYWLNGAIPFSAFFLGVIDLVFALGFIRFLTVFAGR